ncbi:transcription factor IIF subunit tfg1 [Coniothyrium glycines]
MNGTQQPAPVAQGAPVAADGQQPVRRRRPRPQADPLRKPRKPLQNITRPVVSLTQMNAARKPPASQPVEDNTPHPEALKAEFQDGGARVFPLVVTRRDLKELRHHVMRLQSKTHVNVQDNTHFVTPIKLHRRDPRAPPSGAGSHFEEEQTKEDLDEIKQREVIEQQKEERRRAKEEKDAKIAPTGQKKTAAFQKKTEQKYRADDTPEAKKRQLLRYEETLPWHLEDFENKQTWVGTYESELSETHIMLSTTNPENPLAGGIQLAPMERWYRFNIKGKVNSQADGDAAEAIAKLEKGGGSGPHAFYKFESNKNAREREEEDIKRARGLHTRVGGRNDDEGRIRKAVKPLKKKKDGGADDDDDIAGYVKREADADDIDFNLEDDFADDEEGLNGLFEGEEQDVKEAQDKLKRDQLQAAAFERADEEELEKQTAMEKIMKEEQKKWEKGTRKTLARREKQYDYLDSDPENPYITESESDTDSETERQRAKEEEEKKAAEQNGKPVEAKAPDGSNVQSGSSAKESGANTPASGNTPSGSFKSKKRPGSPNLSEASGNESSRKKLKKNKEKLKNRIVIGGSPAGSPGTSRAGSPAAPTKPAIPSAREIYESLPSGGMTIQALIAKFKGRVDKTNSQLFIKLVKAVSSFDKQKSWLTPLDTMPSEEQISNFMGANKST